MRVDRSMTLLSKRMVTKNFFVFFFSSRRRHTRLQGDWSSDVCSSDLLRHRDAILLSHRIRGEILDLSKSIDRRESDRDRDHRCAGAMAPEKTFGHGA